MIDARWRRSIERGTQPVGRAIRRTGVSADLLTAIGLVLAGCTAVAIGDGRIGLGLALLIASSLPDFLDGAVAKAAGTASSRGAFFDSVADRVSDGVVLGGVAWYLASRHGGHAAVLPLAVLGAASLVSYERAKAEALGYRAKGGLMERGERVGLLCVGLAFRAVLVPVLWLMLGLTVVTAFQRFAMVWAQGSEPGATMRAAVVERLWRTGRFESRWRAWRERDVDLTDAERAGSRRFRPTTTPAARWRARREAAFGSRTGRRRRVRSIRP